jgi:hypothetical protein
MEVKPAVKADTMANWTDVAWTCVPATTTAPVNVETSIPMTLRARLGRGAGSDRSAAMR